MTTSKIRLHGSKSAKLSKAEEAGSSILGGEPQCRAPPIAVQRRHQNAFILKPKPFNA